MQRLNEPASDCKPKPGSGADVVALLRPVELVKNVLHISRRNARTFIEDFQTDELLISPAMDGNCRAHGRILRRIVEQVEESLLEQHGIEFQHRQIRCELKPNFVMNQYLVCPLQGAAADLAQIMVP